MPALRRKVALSAPASNSKVSVLSPVRAEIRSDSPWWAQQVLDPVTIRIRPLANRPAHSDTTPAGLLERLSVTLSTITRTSRRSTTTALGMACSFDGWIPSYNMTCRPTLESPACWCRHPIDHYVSLHRGLSISTPASD